MKLSQKDIDFINSFGISVAEIERQLFLLEKGAVYPVLDAPATVENGIVKPDADEEKRYLKIFDLLHDKYDCGRFIPASGAATRMFSFLSDWLTREEMNEQVARFFEHFHRFPFASHVNIEEREEALRKLLFDDWKFARLPKALIPFHRENDKVFTAFESHLAESSQYAMDKEGKILTHFTISEDHQTEFAEKRAEVILQSDNMLHHIAFSFQGKDTDTISMTEEGELLRDENGNPVLRPGGHGALLNNLQYLNEDIIFIRNIDNVVSPSSNSMYVRIHRIMGGMMIEALQHIYELQKCLDEKNTPSSDLISYLVNYWNYQGDNSSLSLRNFVFRPVRICGMVKNLGEPGGGPFWTKEKNGMRSLQIIESSQVNKNNVRESEIFHSATHFNPVDICCSLKNYKGEKYKLADFTNPDFSFLTAKSINGKNCTVLEHPGLWNGSMHNWLTLFIEIPTEVFNPVKTVNDLLREAHQK